MGTTFQVNIPFLVQFLKHNQTGEGVVEALRLRSMIHWLYPEKDPLARQVLGAYEKIAEIVGEAPCTVLDVGCMCGFFRHYLDLNCSYKIHYVGIDRWPEAIRVAKEFLPKDDFRVFDFLKDSGMYRGSYDYVCVNNINFGSDLEAVIERAVYAARKCVLLGMPKHCPDATVLAKSMGLDVDHFDCGESTVTKVNLNGDYNIRGVTDSG